MQKKIYIHFLLLICMVTLILNTDLAIQGAKEGVETCLYSVIPSLFPFFFLTGCLSNTVVIQHTPRQSRLLQLCGIPDGASTLCLLCIISGYPVGAKILYQQYTNGSLHKKTAHRLLGFMNLTSPAFIFGIVSRLLGNGKMALIVWAIQLVSAAIVAIILPNKELCVFQPRINKNSSAVQILENSLKSISLVCGWVVIFKILTQIINYYFSKILPKSLLIFISGILEITNGCFSLSNIDSLAWRFVLCNIFLSFGGLCVWMQIYSVVRDLGSGMFACGKILQTAICGILAVLSQILLYPRAISFYVSATAITCCCIVILTIYLCIHRKNSRNANLAVV